MNKTAEAIRNQGKIVEINLMKRAFAEQQEYAVKAKFDYLIRIDADESMIRMDLKTKSIEKITIEEL